MFIVERFQSILIQNDGKHPVSINGERTWYPPQACRSLKLPHHIHSTSKKGLIERTMQYIKDRIERFDDYFPYKKGDCNLNHVKLVKSEFIPV